ncbi:hypothetical protein GGX14DRAFT_633282 [Mycena pura]|uniref:Uncharacterized protein n=1 Tax=Mycena pura TaxID=153505 RepID=A0AAD6VBU0_9AGAR|nr:hypothetical protein GGX14DRAFT_633282 [Mycena pura]
MGVQENLFVYVDVVRHIEKLGGSKGYASDEEVFTKALKQGLSELLPEDDDHAVIILKYTAKPREIGASEGEKVRSKRPITLQDWLLGLERLGGSKGLEDFLKENPTGIARAKVRHEEKKEPVRLWQNTAAVTCGVWSAGIYVYFAAWCNTRNFEGGEFSFGGAEIPIIEGEISYNDSMFDNTNNADVDVTGVGLVANYYDGGSWLGQSVTRVFYLLLEATEFLTNVASWRGVHKHEYLWELVLSEAPLSIHEKIRWNVAKNRS